VSPLRLVLVTQRFWPQVGRAAKAMANLAVALAGRQAEVTVLTPRWDRRWPAEICYSGVPVVRLANPPRPGRRPARSMRSLARWLRQNQDGYDLVYVSMLRHDAYAALGAVGGRVPVVLRAERAGRLGDCLWQLDAGRGRRIKKRCMRAAALIGPSRAIEQELIAAGYPRRRIHYVPNGVPIRPAANAAGRSSARAAVAGVNPGLQMPDRAPLAVYAGRLAEAKGLGALVAAWGRVVARRPDARLWLVGDGPYRETLRSQIVDRELVDRVFLAGVFDSVEELLAAADLFVMPSREEGPSLALLEAMAAGLPIVATDVPGNRELVSDDVDALLVPVGDADALSAAIGRLLAERELARALGAAAREQAERRFGIAEMADAHLKLFESLVSAIARKDER
jgi:glycosyltransferase involved in cell wall biosynthesis